MSVFTKYQGGKMSVYVLNQRGEPLMPTTPRKARVLLRQGKAIVVRRTPFTIQLTYATGEAKLPISLGVDAGSKFVGLSATTKKKELFAAELTLRSNVTDNIATRAQFRRTRRNRKTRYRPARWLNRVSTKKKGWLAPTITNKLDSHVTIIEKIHKILPVTSINVEVAAFDLQKIKNPDVQGVDYQQGEQNGFWNVREYVLWRDGHKCYHCKGKSKDSILNVHHLQSRKIGGDAPGNLITLCSTCHKAYHAGKIKLDIKRAPSMKHQAFMGIMRWAFFDKLQEKYPYVSVAYGYETKNTRIKLNLPKAHRVDARCISDYPTAQPSDVWYYLLKVRCHNRQLHKATIQKGGYRKNAQTPFVTHGFRCYDKVLFEGKECFVSARRLTGSFGLKTLDGKVVSGGKTYKKLQLLEKRRTMLWQLQNT